jgi:hypothetical protein
MTVAVERDRDRRVPEKLRQRLPRETARTASRLTAQTVPLFGTTGHRLRAARGRHHQHFVRNAGRGADPRPARETAASRTWSAIVSAQSRTSSPKLCRSSALIASASRRRIRSGRAAHRSSECRRQVPANPATGPGSIEHAARRSCAGAVGAQRIPTGCRGRLDEPSPRPRKPSAGAGSRAFWRRGWDLNPRTAFRRSAVFKTAPFDRSGTPPRLIVAVTSVTVTSGV